MKPELDETHDAQRRSWVECANGHADFPIQNLPFAIFDPGDGRPRGGVAIGTKILDLAAVAESGLLEGEALRGARAAAGPALNPLMALGTGPRRSLRRSLSAILAAGQSSEVQARVSKCLHDATHATLHLPAAVGDYTDFYAGIHHALNVGRQFRPDNPLLPNYKYVPIGYHGRASSIRPSGTHLRRPLGQLKVADAPSPTLGPTRRLDYELELAAWIGVGNALGAPIPIAEAPSHIFGISLLNDWSARDIQAWEYQPLGPFLAKNFLTTVSPWIVTLEALAPFRTAPRPRPEGDPAPLTYLSDAFDQAHGAFAISLDIALQTREMLDRGLPHHRLARANATALYWTLAQLLTHHTVGGCNLQPGDLLGTGTISEPTPDGVGSLLELSQGGKSPVVLPDGSRRAFLEDGDEILITGQAHAPGYVSIGFGECRGRISELYTGRRARET